MKTMIQTNPEDARKLLITHPQLSHGILRAQLRLGMINTPVPGVPPTSMPPRQQPVAQPAMQYGMPPSGMMGPPQMQQMH